MRGEAVGLERILAMVRCLKMPSGARKGQGATEYLLILATAAIVVVVVLAMVNGMRAAAPTEIVVNGTNQTLTSAIRQQFANMTAVVAP